mgnify:CR=1 FL=1
MRRYWPTAFTGSAKRSLSCWLQNSFDASCNSSARMAGDAPGRSLRCMWALNSSRWRIGIGLLWLMVLMVHVGVGGPKPWSYLSVLACKAGAGSALAFRVGFGCVHLQAFRAAIFASKRKCAS